MHAGQQHLDGWEELPEFRALQQHMREAAKIYLTLHGHPELEAQELAQGPMVIWASVHRGGSCHPPHVHSDSMVTGTYYAQVPPAGCSPLLFDDPRGRSPYDVMVGIENQLRYGPKGKSGFGVDAVPPFDTQRSFQPRPGAMVLFPPWLVHSVPPSPEAGEGESAEDADANARERRGVPARLPCLLAAHLAAFCFAGISLSFNLFGPWCVCPSVGRGIVHVPVAHQPRRRSATAETAVLGSESDLLADADAAADAAEAAAQSPASQAAHATVLDQAEAMHVSDSDARDEFEKLLAGLGGVDQSAQRPAGMPERRPRDGDYTLHRRED